MTNSLQIFKKPLAEVRTSVVAIFLLVALIGFADSAFLTVEHYRGVIPPCSATSGCETVLTSAYSIIAGIPVSLLGTIYYFLIALGAFMYLESRHGRGQVAAHHSAILKWAFLITVIGFLMSLWFLYLQVFVIHSFCQYCLGSAVTSTILFVMALCILFRKDKSAAPISHENL